MKKLSANVCAVTHEGRVRKENEDNYSLNGRHTNNGGLKKGSAYVQKVNEPFHLAVCDGMGGESFGEIASGIAVETIVDNAQKVYNSGDNFASVISECLNDANGKICTEISARGARMGTTLATIYVNKGKVICASLGDTRIYHFSNGMLQQASFDHTHAQGIIDSGVVSAGEIGTIPDAKRLTKHLGVMPGEGDLQPNISVIEDVDNGDIILLCSDGLTDMLSDEEISDVVNSGDSPQDVSGKLIRKALERGGKDNVTVITAFMQAEENALFTPVAQAMVGGKSPNYEEEYRSSFGGGEASDNTSPYAKADAAAYENPVDKKKILMIAGIALGVILVLALAIIIIKAAIGDKEETTTSPSAYYESLYPTTSTTESVSIEISTTEEVTEPSTEEVTETELTETAPKTTNPRPTATKPTNRNTTRSTTTKRPTQTNTATTESTTTVVPSSSTTQQDDTTASTETTTEKEGNGGSGNTTEPENYEITTLPTTATTTQTTENSGGEEQ